MTSSKTQQPPRESERQDNGKRRWFSRLVVLMTIAVGGLFLMSFTAPVPTNLGVKDGKLAECPASPNCVSSQTQSAEHRMEPIAYQGTQAKTVARIKNTVETNFPRSRLVTESEGYLRYEFTSLVFRFVDDVEFFVDDKDKVIHFRSASRVGHSDLGANRRRMDRITKELTL
jgi:uncharacterized protein (DUF1499 family)